MLSKSAKGLQSSLDKISIYAEEKRLTISTTKSKTMVFNQAGKYIKEHFRINTKILEPVKSFCYLGFEVKSGGTVKHAMNIMNEKANKALRPLLCAIARFQLPVKTATKLFHTLIAPIALYNVEIWATLTNKQLDKFEVNDPFEYVENSKLDILHRKILKYILGLNKT